MSFGKDLAGIGEGLEFQRVTGGIQKEHRCLLPNLALEPDLRFNFKMHAQSVCVLTIKLNRLFICS